jgi:hypothetical protein
VASKKQETEIEVYEQVEDEHGRTRLDRPLTAEEARAQDERHRAILVENIRKRFDGVQLR